jgi:hypothetical protein
VSDKKNEFIKVMTPKFRVSFPNVFQPKAIQEGQEPKYSISMLFDAEAQATADFKKMKQAAMKAKKQKWGDNPPKNLRNPFREGSEKSQFEGYEDGVIFVSANSKQRPGLVDQKVNDIIDPQDFYAGCYARATLLAFAYDTMGNKGVAFLLCNVQKVDDGEPISGKSRAQDDFDALASSDSDDEFDMGEDDDFDL